MNDGQERIWKEAIVMYFKALYKNLSGETEENHDVHW
jgi:hypothetical protein